LVPRRRIWLSSPAGSGRIHVGRKSRRLKEIFDGRTGAGAEFKMVPGPRYDENIAGVFTENVKIPLAFLGFLVAVKARLLQLDVGGDGISLK
jgi:hypothetical protein